MAAALNSVTYGVRTSSTREVTTMQLHQQCDGPKVSLLRKYLYCVGIILRNT